MAMVSVWGLTPGSRQGLVRGLPLTGLVSAVCDEGARRGDVLGGGVPASMPDVPWLRCPEFPGVRRAGCPRGRCGTGHGRGSGAVVHDPVVAAAGAGAAGAGAVAGEHLGEVQPLSSIRSRSAPPRSSQVWLKWCRNRCG